MIIPYMGLLTQGKRLLDALFTRTQRQLLGLFFGHPEASYHLNEVVRRAGVGTGSVQRELARLTRAGLLNVRRVGNQKRYQANPEVPIFAELCAIARKTVGIAEELRRALGELDPAPDLALLYMDDAQNVAAPLRVLVVSDRLSPAALGAAFQRSSERIGRSVHPWLLDRRRFGDLAQRGDPRLMRVLEGPRVLLGGSSDPAQWEPLRARAAP